MDTPWPRTGHETKPNRPGAPARCALPGLTAEPVLQAEALQRIVSWLGLGPSGHVALADDRVPGRRVADLVVAADPAGGREVEVEEEHAAQPGPGVGRVAVGRGELTGDVLRAAHPVDPAAQAGQAVTPLVGRVAVGARIDQP